MSSILTNTSAMVALQTLKGINANLARVQDQISTGKSVATAKDNAAVWSISKVMESDVQSFKGISDSLSLGQSTVSVARKASETVTDLLTQMKTKIVAAQEENVDRAKIQADVAALRDQIASVVGAAQFNGLNLVNGSRSSVDFLSSLDRSGSTVTASSITVAAHDLSIGAYAAKAAFSAGTGVTAAQDAQAFNLDAGASETITIDAGAGFVAGDKISIRIGNRQASYTITAEDAASTTPADIVAVGLKSAIETLGIDGLTVDYDSGTPGQLTLNNGGTRDLAVSAQFQNAGSGGLGALGGIDVSTGAGAAAALGVIDGLIDTAVAAAADFGSAQGRIESQADFVSKLSDALRTGIGSMVDADMEEASARLQALQVQQQLGVQALSIANQAPQSILSLFR
ncbi:Flagellin/related hook-associated protein [Rubellimicrobium thermophilum DSM 16684]|uniref:Flagellin n=1 Tax=Rubellimicrobium thermophilum DSM 16684 TaxID=1123069 RepID=S9SD56_9RHOB|nr:flagellin [Rubellimicrobium thermophilum]EPX84149.1 Flagellin/related hook-associated protein [Rubellimicrobium thermophilum DSM 16684]